MNSDEITQKFYPHLYQDGYLCVMNELEEDYKPENAVRFMNKAYGLVVKEEDVYYGKLLPAYDLYGKMIDDAFLHPVFVKGIINPKNI